MISGTTLRKMARTGAKVHCLTYAPVLPHAPDGYINHFATKAQADRELQSHAENWANVPAPVYSTKPAAQCDFHAAYLV